MARGKIIAHWQITANQLTIDVPVRMHNGSPTQFSVDVTFNCQRFNEYNKDIDELKKAVKEWLKGAATFDYKPFFYVEFDGFAKKPSCGQYGDIRTSLYWRTLDVGKTAGGRTLYRDCSRQINCGNWIEGEPNVGLQGDEVCALVPATPENEAALIKLVEAFETLHSRLRALLSPEQIGACLTKISGEVLALRSE